MPKEVPQLKAQAVFGKADAGGREPTQLIFEWFTKVAGLSLAIVYVVGFLVVTGHLAKYGASSLSLLHLQYLVAGVWVLAPLVVIRFVQVAGWRFSDQALATHEGRTRISWYRRIVVATITSIPGILVIAAVGSLVGEVKGLTWGEIAGLCLLYGLLANAFDITWALWRASREADAESAPPRRAFPFASTVLLAMFLVYVSFFTSKIYPVLPYAVGGGRPLRVVFLLRRNEVPGFLIRDGTSPQTIPYRLLTASEKSYVVLSPNPEQSSIEFSRDAVLGLAVLKDSPPR